MYPSGQDNPGTSYDEGVPSANSPSTKEDEDSNVDGSDSGSDGDSSNEENVGNAKSPIRSVIGPDGLRQFLLPLMWSINNFNSIIKRPHFETFRDRYQIPINVPICLPFKFEKCYYQDVEDVGVYEQMFKAGLRLPLSTLHRRLLQYLGIAVTQITPNSWRVFLGAKVLYRVLTNGERKLTVEEFFHCYRPTEIVQSRGMYSFLPRKPLLRLVCETPDSNKNWKSQYFFLQVDN